MQRCSMKMIAFLALFATVATQSAISAQTASLDLLRRATNPNPTLRSYTATAQLSATLHVLLPVHRTFNGTVYYLKPRRKIELENVSGSLSRFKDLASSAPSYEELTTDYTVTPLGDTGTISSYALIAKKTGGRVERLLFDVDDARALVLHVRWLYTNGGQLDLNQTYEAIQTYRLPVKADIAARFPGYSVDGTLTFSNYQPNAPVSPAVFSST